MTNHPYDKRTGQDHEPDLERVREALSGTDPAEPPRQLDQAVLNRARRELEKPAARWTRPRRMRWLGAFTTAAIVVLALTVVVHQDQPVPTPSPPAADGLKLEKEVTAGQSAEKRSDAFRAKARAAPLASSDEAQPAEIAADQALEEYGLPDAESWIQDLLQLKENGQEAALAEELQAFKKAYPGYPLPPDLER